MRLLSLLALLAAGSVAMADDAKQLGRYEPGSAAVEDAGHKYRAYYGGGYYGGYRDGYYGGYSYYRPSVSYYYGGYRPYYPSYSYYYAPAPVYSYYYTPRWCGISNPAPGGVSLSITLGPREPLASGGLPSPYAAPKAPAPQVAPTPEPPNLDVKISDPAVRKAMRYPAYGDKN